ncbi:MAG: aspartate aminotransferase family protein [Candidatus Bathyarchaeia archaeon]|jgi:diaminobutyrate-2-oxoglutarate transaminase
MPGNTDDFAELSFPEAPKIIVKPPGPKARALLEKQKEVDSRAVYYATVIPTAWETGKGATLQDVDGNTYVDFMAGISVLNVGHSNPYVVEAVKRQLDKLTHALDIPTPERIRLVEKLVEIAPAGLKDNSRVLFGGPSGSDAVEGALKIAKFNTKHHAILAFHGAYHGMTSGALSVTSKRSFRTGNLPLLPDIHFAPYAYCYRCAFEREYPECNMQCTRYIEYLFKDPESGLTDPAAIIVEPIQGEGGFITPPDGYLKELRRICDENKILLIVDEIQSGFGRAGKMFACEYEGITPDVMPIAKAVGGIGIPLAGCVIKKNLDTWEPGAHLGTFRGNVLACVAGYEAIDFTLQKGLVDRSAREGAHMMRRLKDLQQETKTIGEVRGKGLMVAAEFVEDRRTKKPAVDLVKKIQFRCFERGVLVWKAGHWPNVVRFLPPLVITRDHIDKGLDVFSDVVKEAEREL